MARALNYAQKRDAATAQTERVEKSEAGHPKSWDRYVEKRQKDQQKLAGGKKHANA